LYALNGIELINIFYLISISDQNEIFMLTESNHVLRLKDFSLDHTFKSVILDHRFSDADSLFFDTKRNELVAFKGILELEFYFYLIAFI